MTLCLSPGPDQTAPRVRRAYPARRQRRQVSDDIMIAFHCACDMKDLLIAQRLLQAFETLLTRRQDKPDPHRPRAVAVLVAAHERLWNLRVGETDMVLPAEDQSASPPRLAAVPVAPHRWPAVSRGQ